MDAKAKVVAHRWFSEWPAPQRNVLGPGEWRYSTGDDFHPDYAEALITLTDHEAALAEVVAERDAWQRLAGEWQQATERRKEENQTLLTGLEALAGELDLQKFNYAADRIRTLASAGLEGKPE